MILTIKDILQIKLTRSYLLSLHYKSPASFLFKNRNHYIFLFAKKGNKGGTDTVKIPMI